MFLTLLYINGIIIYSYEVYTKVSNVFIDKVIDNVFIRNFFTKKHSAIPFLLYTQKYMSPQKIREIENMIIEKQIKQLIKRFCHDLDIEYLEKIPESIKKVIIEQCQKMEKDKTMTWLSTFFLSLLTYEYDEKNPIIIDLNATINNQSSTIISKKPLHLETLLHLEKEQIDNFGSDEKRAKYYSEVIKLLDRLRIYSKEVEKRIPNKVSITNSWLKCWEMCNVFKLVPENHTDKFTIFCNGELPGSFILALNHYIKTQTTQKKFEWYANSLIVNQDEDNKLYKNNKEIFTDFFKLYEKYPQRWLMSKDKKDQNGDIMKPEMRDIIIQKLENKVDLYTGDISLGLDKDEENIEVPYLLSQIICGLQVLKNGGTMVCRIYSFFKAFTMSLLRLLCNVFTSLCITKPMASRPSSSDIYIVGKGYTKDNVLIDRLIEILSNWNDETINTYFEPITEDFYVKLVYCSYYIYKRQLFYLEENMSCVEELYKITKNPKEISEKLIRQTIQKEHFDFRQAVVDEWKHKFPISNLAKEFAL